MCSCRTPVSHTILMLWNLSSLKSRVDTFPSQYASMAALGRIIGRRSPNVVAPSFLLPPALLICCRRITSKLFVGGLSFYTTEEGLLEHFSQYGQVVEAKIVMDRVSDRSKGFGFVTFASEEEAQKARTETYGKELNGRTIFVDYAKPRSGFRSEMPIARGPPEPVAETRDRLS